MRLGQFMPHKSLSDLPDKLSIEKSQKVINFPGIVKLFNLLISRISRQIFTLKILGFDCLSISQNILRKLEMPIALCITMGQIIILPH